MLGNALLKYKQALMPRGHLGVPFYYYIFIILLGVKGKANSCIIKNDVRNYCIKKGERSLTHYVMGKFFWLILLPCVSLSPGTFECLSVCVENSITSHQISTFSEGLLFHSYQKFSKKANIFDKLKCYPYLSENS